MKAEFVHIDIKKVDIDFQKIFDFMKKEYSFDSIDDYDTEFGDNVHYYLNKVFGLNFEFDNTDNCTEFYPYDLNEYEVDRICNEYSKWLEENEEKLLN